MEEFIKKKTKKQLEKMVEGLLEDLHRWTERSLKANENLYELLEGKMSDEKK